MAQRNDNHGILAGRAAVVNPDNRFETIHREDDLEHLDGSSDFDPPRRVTTQFLEDQSQSILAENDSPDINFRYSINPYRGCEHGCAYCYARPGHEFLGMNAGLDFESKIIVKHNAADLLRDALNRPNWRAEKIAISGVTDCYQPAERNFRITRSLLEVLSEARQPFGIITKNALVTRDIDLLAPLAAMGLVVVNISLTTLDPHLGRSLEPRTASPKARLKAITQLANAGIPVRVMTAPIIPGLNDHEVPQLLAAASDAGAIAASYVLLRLPLSVEPIFFSWLKANYPDRLVLVESRIRSTRGGSTNHGEFGRRMRGEGSYAEGICQTFTIFRRKYGLDQELPPLDSTQFRPPRSSDGQLRLF